MKVLIIGFTRIAYMPYMQFYINKLHELNYDVSLIYWDREGAAASENLKNTKLYCYSAPMLDSATLSKKIPHFIKYRNYANRIIKAQQFDMIIVLHSTPGVLLADTLIKKYPNQYILDYRDFTYENFQFYKKIIHKLINNSIMTFVSSKGYLKYLPKSNNIFISHNLLLYSEEKRNVRKYINREVNPIRIRFWGFIRHLEVNKLIIDRFGNDVRFELHYHGREQDTAEKLKAYVESMQFSNIHFHGEYAPEERVNFAAKTDLLHNIYENDVKTKNAMGNKFYDGLSFYIPQICNIDSFMGKEIESAGLGKMFDPNSKDFSDDIFNYYHKIDWQVFTANCDNELERITKEYNSGLSKLHNTLNRKKEE